MSLPGVLWSEFVSHCILTESGNEYTVDKLNSNPSLIIIVCITQLAFPSLTYGKKMNS